jgi:hypothetical protein
MDITYIELHKLAEYGRTQHGWTSYPVHLASKTLVEQGKTGRINIYPNDRYIDGDGLPDVVYPSIANAANNGNTRYLQKGHHYAAWYPRAERNMKLSQIN